jgi:hypothetical protein
VTSVDHRIYGLGRWRGPSLAEKQSHIQLSDGVVEENHKVNENQETGDEKGV